MDINDLHIPLGAKGLLVIGAYPHIAICTRHPGKVLVYEAYLNGLTMYVCGRCLPRHIETARAGGYYVANAAGN